MNVYLHVITPDLSIRQSAGDPDLKVLFVVNEPFFRKEKGNHLRFWSIYQALLSQSIDIHLFYTSHLHESSEPIERVGFAPVRMLARERMASLRRLLHTGSFDLVIVTHPYATEVVMETKKLGIVTIVDTHNCESSRSMMRARGRSLVSQTAVIAAEAIYLRMAAQVWTVSVDDEAAYKRRFGLSNTVVIPNAMADPEQVAREEVTLHSILFVGSFLYRPNMLASLFLLQDVLPRVLAECPDARLVLAGRSPPSAIVDHASDCVKIVANPEHVGPLYRQTHVVVAPVWEGGGTKFKVIEALAHGKVLIATPHACAGIAIRADEHYLRCDSAQTMAEQVLRAFRDAPLCVKLGDNARQYFTDHLSQTHVNERVRQAIALVTQGRPVM